MYRSLTHAELRTLLATSERGVWRALGYGEDPRVPTVADIALACEINDGINDLESELIRRCNRYRALWSRAYEYAAGICHGEPGPARQFAEAYARDFAGQDHVPTPRAYNSMDMRRGRVRTISSCRCACTSPAA